MARGDRYLPRVHVIRVHPRVDQFDRGQRAVAMHGVSHQCERGNIVVIPQPAFDERCDVAGRVYFHFLGTHDRPSALGFDAAHGREALRPRMAHAVAMGHLEKTILRRHGTDFDRFEKNVVARVAGHAVDSSV